MLPRLGLAAALCLWLGLPAAGVRVDENDDLNVPASIASAPRRQPETPPPATPATEEAKKEGENAPAAPPYQPTGVNVQVEQANAELNDVKGQLSEARLQEDKVNEDTRKTDAEAEEALRNRQAAELREVTAEGQAKAAARGLEATKVEMQIASNKVHIAEVKAQRQQQMYGNGAMSAAMQLVDTADMNARQAEDEYRQMQKQLNDAQARKEAAAAETKHFAAISDKVHRAADKQTDVANKAEMRVEMAEKGFVSARNDVKRAEWSERKEKDDEYREKQGEALKEKRRVEERKEDEEDAKEEQKRIQDDRQWQEQQAAQRRNEEREMREARDEKRATDAKEGRREERDMRIQLARLQSSVGMQATGGY